VDPCVVDPMGPSSRLEGIQLSKKTLFQGFRRQYFFLKTQIVGKKKLIQVELKCH
jgi:hypothetical protein